MLRNILGGDVFVEQEISNFLDISYSNLVDPNYKYQSHYQNCYFPTPEQVYEALLREKAAFKSFYPGVRDDTIKVHFDYQRTYYDCVEFIVKLSGYQWESDHDYLNRIDVDKAAVARAKEQKAIAAKKAAEDEKELYIRLHEKYGSGIK
jgi:hypothetical protein